MQLSNAAGSFVSPVFTQNSAATSIIFSLPNSLNSGTAYRIRVLRLGSPTVISDTLQALSIISLRANFGFSPNNACANTSVSFSDSSSGALGLTYLYTFNNTYTHGAPVSSGLPNPVVKFNPFFGGGTVTYSVKLRVTSVAGCVDSVSKLVSVKQQPLAALQDSNIFAYPAFSNCTGAPSASNARYRLTVNNMCEVKATIANITLDWGEGLPQNLPGTFVQASHEYTSLGAYNMSIRAQNNNGCENTQNYLVSNQISPTLSIGGPTNKQGCAPFTYPIVLSNYSTNTAGTYYIIDFNDGTPKLRIDTLNNDTVWHTFATNSCSRPGGFFVVRATAYNQCDSTSTTLGNFRIWTKPDAKFNILPSSSICGGDTATFVNTTTAAQYGASCANTTLYSWQFSGASISSSTMATPPPVIYNTGGVFPVRLIATNPCGSDTFESQVCVQASPIANFSYQFNPSQNCKSHVLRLTDISSTTTACGASTLAWSIRDSSSNALLNAGTDYEYIVGKSDSSYAEIMFKNKGIYKLRLFIQNACGTHFRDSIIRINDLPSASFTQDTLVFCDSTFIAYNTGIYNLVYDSSFNQSMSFSWVISPSGYTITQGTASSRNPVIKFTNYDTIPKIYRVIHGVSNLCGIGKADTQLVVINPKPRVFVSPPQSLICSGQSTNIQLSSSIIGGVSYTWRAYSNNPSLSGFSSQATASPGLIAQVIQNNALNTDTVFYKIVANQQSTSCRGDSSLPVRVLVQPAIQNNILSKSTPICAGDSAPIISGTIPLGGSGAIAYQWQRWSGSAWQNTTSADTLSTYWPGFLGSTQIYRRLASSKNCLSAPVSMSNADTLLVRTKPIVNAGTDINTCLNKAAFTLNGLPGGGIWSGLNLQGANGFNPALSGLGSYTFVYLYTDTFGCKNSDTLGITVNNVPVVTAGANQTVCSNADTLVLASGSPSAGIWSGLGVLSANKFLPPLAGNGVHTLRYTYTDINNCSASDSIDMIVKEKPNAVFSLLGGNNRCEPAGVVSQNNSLANNAEPFSSLRFKWFQDASLIDTTPNINKTYTNTGVIDSVYTLKLWTQNTWGCTDSTQQILRIWPHAKANLTLSNTQACAPFLIDTNHIKASHYPQANGTYVWYKNGIQIGTGLNFPGALISAANDSIYIELKVQSLQGCKNDSVGDWFKTISNPTPAFSAVDTAVCSGAFLQLINQSSPATGLDYTWYLGSQQDSSKLAEPSKQVFNYGNTDSLLNIKLIAQLGSGGCKDSIQKTMRIRPLPKLNISLSDSVVCYPNTVLATQTASALPALNAQSFVWSSGAIINNDTSNSSISLQFADNNSGLNQFTFIKVRAQTLFGCIDSVQKTIRRASRPQAQFSFSKDSSCAPFVSLVQDQSAFAFRRKWSSAISLQNDTAISSQVNIPKHTGSNDSIYKVNLLSVSIDGCRDSIEKSLRAYPVPVPAFSSSLDSACSPMLVTFFYTGEAKANTQKLWKFGDGTQSSSLADSSQKSFVGSVLGDTLYSVGLVLTSINGCKDSMSLNDRIKVKSSPKARFSTNIDSACSPLNVFVSDESVGNPTQYKWVFGNGDSSLSVVPPQPIVYTSNDTNTQFRLRLQVSNECGVDTFSKALLVRAEYIESKFSASAKIACERLTVAFGDASIGAKFVTWDFGDGFGSSQRNPVHTYTTPGVYMVRQYANNSCSYDTSMQEITILPKPNFNIELPTQAICEDMPVSFASNLFTPGTLFWEFGDGANSTAQNPVHIYTTPGKKILRVSLTSQLNNCVSEIIDTLDVVARPSAVILVDTVAACFGHAFTFQSQASAAYLRWDMGDGVKRTGASVLGYEYANPGTYVVKLVAENIEGCLDSNTLTINVWPKPKVDFYYTPVDTCNGPATVFFSNLSSGADAYHWDFGNGNTATTVDASAFYSGLGKYNIKLHGVNAYGCRESITKVFEILEQAFASFDMDDSSGCLPLPVKFNNTSKGAKTYVWYFGDGDTSSAVNPLHTYTKSGIYFVSLVAKAGNVCRDSFTFYKPIKIDEKVAITFSHELIREQVPHRTVTFTTDVLNDFEFEWRFGEGSTAKGRTVTHRYLEGDSGCFNVELKVISNNNCDTLHTDTVCLPSYWEGLSLPNAFTPDYGSDEVRVFKPIGLGLVQYHIKIYNKWGSLVWEDTELQNGTPAKGWDGKDLSGEVCMPGAYIWVVEATFISGKSWKGAPSKDGKSFMKRGSLTLIR